MKLFGLLVPICLLSLSTQRARSEMIINTKDGQRYIVPVNSDEVTNIEFNSNESSGGAWQGVWQTSEGKMNLSQVGNTIEGTYNQDAGKIQGTVSNNVLNGYWIEDSSAIPCQSKKLNSLYWGKISWQIAPNGRSFNGKWNYCNDEPSSNWNGTR